MAFTMVIHTYGAYKNSCRTSVLVKEVITFFGNCDLISGNPLILMPEHDMSGSLFFFSDGTIAAAAPKGAPRRPQLTVHKHHKQ